MKLRYKILAGIGGLICVAVAALAMAVSYTPDCGPREPVAARVETMKAIQYRCYGSPDILEYVDVEKPVPLADQVLVRVEAAAVNPLDWHYMRGSPYFMRLGSGIGKPKDTSLGVDFAGTVESVGEDVTRFRPGDNVFGGASGAFAEYVVVRENGSITRLPDGVSFEQGAAVPVAGVTAIQALRDSGQLQAGQSVLINGASGGVGTYAVQIAKAMGADVTGVCSTRNVEMVLSLGADRVIDYTEDDYTRGDAKYDLIVDMVGNHPLSANRGVLKPDGRLVIVGGPKGDWLTPLLRPLWAFITSPFVDQEMGMMLARMRQEDLAAIAELMAEGKVISVLDQAFALQDTPDAVRHSETGRARGKIIVDLYRTPATLSD